MDDRERLKIILRRLAEENEYDLEEYDRWIALAEKAGSVEAAGLIRTAKESMEGAGRSLRAAWEVLA